MFSRDLISLIFSLHDRDDLVLQESGTFHCGIVKDLIWLVSSLHYAERFFCQEPTMFPEPLEVLDLDSIFSSIHEYL